MSRSGRRIRILASLAAAISVLGGCQVPQDPDGTLERVRDGTLRVGLTHHEPWVVLGDPGEPQGVEPELIRRFAARLNAEIDWFEGSEAALIGALKVGGLDLVAGGLTTKSPWKKEAALTRAYLTTRLVVGVPPATSSWPDDFEGVDVAFERGSEAGGLLERRTDARPVPVAELREANGAVAADMWLLDDLRLRATGVELARHRHVMAAPMGENAFLVELERFLLERTGEIRGLLERVARP